MSQKEHNGNLNTRMKRKGYKGNSDMRAASHADPFRKVTLESLKKNKTRTMVTIIGIILSAAMICAVTTFASSAKQYMVDYAVYQTGNWHGREQGTPYEIYEKINADAGVSDAVYFQQLGYAKAEGCINLYKPYIYLLGSGKEAERVLPIHLLEGRYPSAPDEILLPEHLETNGGVRYEIGDTLTLELGERILDGYAMTQDNPCYYTEAGEEIMHDEELVIREKREFTVVGFFERISWLFEDYYAPGYTAFTVADEMPSDACLYDVYFRMEHPRDVYAYMEDNGLTGERNTQLLLYSGVSRFDSLYVTLYGLAAIVIALIMFGSISLIYNAFSISVSERTKQFGLLSSVGATKKQIRKMVLFEAFCVSAIGIPIGICSGIGGIGVTIVALGDQFLKMGIPLKMRLVISPLSVVAAIAIALVTVLISAWIPAKRATSMSAIEAIRQGTDTNSDGRPMKTTRSMFARNMLYKWFGLPGMLADKYYKHSKKRYRATILSLFMSIVLFVCASAFTNYMMEAARGGLGDAGYDLWVGTMEEDFEEITKEELLEKLKGAQEITDVTMLRKYYASARISEEYLTERCLENLSSWGSQPSDLEEGEVGLNLYIRFIDEESYQELLKAQNLNVQEYMDVNHPRALVLDGIRAFNSNAGRYETTTLLQSGSCELTMVVAKERDGYWFYGEMEDEEGNTVARYEKNNGGLPEAGAEFLDIPIREAYDSITLEIGDIIYDRTYYLPDNADGIVLLYPMSFEEILFSGRTVTSNEYEYYLLSNHHAVSFQAIQTLLKENGISEERGYDAAEQAEGERSAITVIRVFAYGFIVLISLIAVANVFNTITTNIHLRRREFAMLKSVGMTEGDFYRMMNFECVLYGIRALLYGIPVSLGITFLIWQVTSAVYETTFLAPWAEMGIAALSVFAVVFVTMLYAMRKVKRENIMDALKNETL